jgi:16S rRNA (cytosine1402-N4)-methyltransferase
VSSFQFDEGNRGFSFSADGPLDMRMDDTQGETAADLVNTLSEEALADILRTYGEEKRAKALARAIVAARHANSVAAGEEDVWSHKRKVTPGDHREKLQSETIRQLDEIFGPVLDKLGYSGASYLETGIPVSRQ